MATDSQPKIKVTLGGGIASRATNVVLAATLAASMVPTAAFAAFQDEVYQGTEANAQSSSDQVAALSSNAAADEASSTVTDVYGDAVADGDAASLGLDHANLPDGQYSVTLMMMNINGRQVSMSNGAVGGVIDGTTGQHSMTLDVVDGEYWLTMRWVPLERNLGGTPFVGYLANLAYFEDYSFTPYLQGTKVPAKVLSQYVNEDGTPVYDDYNNPDSDAFVGNNVYPKDVQIKISGASLEDGMQPVHVFVPVMDAIMTGAGDQNAYVKLFWNSLSVNYLTTDKVTLKNSLDAANALEQGKKSDDAWNALKSAIATAQGVYDNAAATQEKVNAAATTLDAAVKTFQDSADVSGVTDPFDGVIETEAFYVAGQKFVDASGNAIASSDAAFSGTTLNIRRVDAAEGRYEVKLQTRYTDPAGPVITAVSYEAADDAARSAKAARKVRDSANGTGWHTVEWRIYVDDLSQQQKLDVQYTANGEAKSQTLYITPLKADAKLGTPLEAMTGKADFYRTNNYLDATGLFLAIEDAKAVEQGNKTDDAWNTLQAAIDAAQKVYDNTSKQQDDCDSAVETLNAAVKAFQDSADQAKVDPFDGKLQENTRYQTAQFVYDENGESIGNDNPINGAWTMLEYVESDKGKYAVTVIDPYNLNVLSTQSQVTAISYVASDGSTQSAELVCDRRLGNESTWYSRQGEWRLYVDDLSSKVKLDVTYNTGESATSSMTMYLLPLSESATETTSMLAAMRGDYMKSTGTDFSPLYGAIQDAKAIEQGKKTDDAWNTLQGAISTAQGVLDTNSTKQDGITSAVSDLNAAVETFKASADKEVKGKYGLTIGTPYQTTGTFSHVSTTGSASTVVNLSSTNYIPKDATTFDVDLRVWGSKYAITSVKYATSSNISAAQEAMQSDDNFWRAFSVNLDKPLWGWITYTDRDGTQHTDSMGTISWTSMSKSVFTEVTGYRVTDSGYLYDALKSANALAYDYKKGESAWAALCEAKSAASKIISNRNTHGTAYTQEEIDAATDTLKKATEAYRTGAEVEGATMHGFEKGARYGSPWVRIYDADGNRVSQASSSNPFFTYSPDYKINDDGTFKLVISSYDTDKETIDAPVVTSVKYSLVDDESTAKEADHTAGAVGSYKYGFDEWTIDSVSGIADIYYWVTYTDTRGTDATHVNQKFRASLYRLDDADHGFVKYSSKNDASALYKVLKKAEAITEDENKTHLSWVAFDLVRETMYIEYINRNGGSTQEEIDGNVTAMQKAIDTYLNGDNTIADFSKLKASIATAQTLVDAGAGDKQDKAFELLKAQLDAANVVASDRDYQQSRVDEAQSALDAVIAAYNDSATKTSTAALADAIATATELKAGGCVNGLTPISNLSKAITAAQGVYDKATGFADDQIVGTDAEVTDATTAMNEAIEAFKEACKVDKSALESALTEAKAIEQGKKSDEAFQKLQQAIAAAEKVADNNEASQDDVDKAVEALKSSVDTFNNSADVVDGLDFDNLEDGTYTVNVDMYKAYDRESKSMSDQAINHEVELTVKNGEHFLTFDFQGLKYLGKFGYLGWLKYYDQGYTYNQYGVPTGDVVDATVLSTQKNADGSDVYDEFNTDGSEFKLFAGLYPDKVQIKYVQTARDDAEGYIPLQVFVPVMESIAAGNGTQDVLAKVDKASLKKKEAAAIDATELEAAIASAENALATSKKSDADNAKLRRAVQAAQAALSKEGATQGDIDAALNTLNTAIDTFKKAPDAVVVDKSKLVDAIAKAEAVKQGNKTDSAWEALQAAITKAKGTNNSADATQADVDTATTTLNNAVNTFNASADKPADTQLDFANLPAGTYSITIDMYKMNRTDKSMSDAAINHKAKLTVDENGDYWLTLDFASVKSGTTNGYLGSLSYYDEGYTYSGAKVMGSLVAGNVVDYQTGTDGKQYPNHVTVKFVKTARADADHFIPLQVFVPVMEEIAADCGTQDVLAKYDPSSVQKLDGEIPDQTEPGVNGNGSTGDNGNGSGTTVTGPTTASKSASPTVAAKTAAGATLGKTGDATAGLVTTAIAGMVAAATAVGALLRRRFGKQEGEE